MPGGGLCLMLRGMTISLTVYNRLVSKVYETLVPGAEWSSLVHDVAESFAAPICGLSFDCPEAQAQEWLCGFDDGVLDTFFAGTYELDRRPPDGAAQRILLKTARRPALSWRTKFIVDDYYPRMRCPYVLGAAAAAGRAPRSRLFLMRQFHMPRFSEAERTALAGLNDHIALANGLRRRLAGAADRDGRLDELRCRFGLTPRELEVAAALGRGATTAALAQALGMKVETARSHVKSVLSKTGTHSRAALMLLLLGDGD